MRFIRQIPLFVLLLILYNIAAFADFFQSNFNLETLVAKFPLASGLVFTINMGELLLLSGVALLYLELLKSTRTTKPYLLEHMLSMLVFLIFLVEFFMVKQAGTIVFLILTIMSLLDVLGGFTVTISRHVVLPGTAAALAVAAAEATPIPAPEPEPEPEPVEDELYTEDIQNKEEFLEEGRVEEK
jgi:hypothetical protein